MNADKNVVARFEKKTYELKVTKEGEGLVNEEIYFFISTTAITGR